jgi:Ca-activated chloride channel family protein
VEAQLRLEHTVVAVETEHRVHVMVELTAPAAPESERAPLDVALVVDRSGSMSGGKLAAVKACGVYLARRMGAGDRLAVVAYDDAIDLVAPLAPVELDRLLPAIGALRPGGTTNLSGGWLKGLEQLRGTQREEAVRRILLLTDGLANVGITEPGALIGLAEQARQAGVGTTTIGVGDDFDEALLTAMADAGGGSGHFAATPDSAPGIFAAEFDGLASVVAQNVSVEIRPGPDVEMLGVLNDYPATPVPGGVQLALGDAYGDEVRRVVFELHLPSVAALGLAKVGEVIVRHVSVGAEVALHEVTVPLMVNVVTPEEASGADPDHAVVEEVLILRAARSRDEARDLAGRGDYDAGRALLSDSAKELRRHAAGSPRARYLQVEAESLEQAANWMDGADPMAPPSAAMLKRMHYDSHLARRRRHGRDTEPGPDGSDSPDPDSDPTSF